MTQEVLKQALEALEHCCFSDELVTDKDVAADAILAIKKALAQPQQEPVYKYCDDGKVIFTNPEILSRRSNKENT